MRTEAPPAAETRARVALAPSRHRVGQRVRETRSSVTLTLEPVDTDETLPAGRPGQFNMLWAPGVGEVPISFSAIGDVGRQVHTIRAVGPVSRKLCEARVGDVLGLRGPFGSTWPVDEARGRDLIVVGGGIGLAPVRPVVQAVLAERRAFGEVSLIVGARQSRDLLFRAELDGWWRRRDITVRTIVDQPSADWRGNVGVVTKELQRIEVDPGRTMAIACGPEIMMKFVAEHLIDRGLAPADVAVSMERNMQCAIGQCGHCQLRGYFICTDGPVFTWPQIRPLLEVREL